MAQTDRKPILIIEDDKDIRLSLVELLQAEEHEVFSASNGKEGLECLMSIPPPCLILLDLFMPEMDGPTFLDVLEREHRDMAASIPVVVLSAAPPTSEVAQRVKAQVAGYINK